MNGVKRCWADYTGKLISVPVTATPANRFGIDQATSIALYYSHAASPTPFLSKARKGLEWDGDEAVAATAPTLRIVVDDAGAVYPLEIEMTITGL